MQMTGNTILITGGGSGIGRALAEAFQHRGNQVIIAGRRQQVLDQATAANPGLKSMPLDIENKQSIEDFAAQVVREYPALNVVINNAGIMQPEDLLDPRETLTAESTIAINLLGPIRLTAALLPHLRKQPLATVMTVSSGLAFIPLTITPTYCATKAAIHSYTQSLRHQLKETHVEVIEIIPPYVQTELMGPQQTSDPRAMPLTEFISETMHIFETEPNAREICVERVRPLRFSAESGHYDDVFNGVNASFAASH
jgi:uncharacterized oxidoreductase